MIKVSVLVAVYNSAKYLGECLDSLLSQTLTNIEVICIDDGSTDDSYVVMQEYAMRDERVKCIKLDRNHGQNFARNEGLKIAEGEIIAYLDSDDWYAVNSLELIADVFDKHPLTDCVLFRCIYVDEDGTKREYDGKTFEVKNGREAFLDSLTWAIHGVYAVRAQLMKAHPYDCATRHFSDDNTTRIHYYLSREVRSSEAPYYYRQHQSSVTHVISTSRMDYMKATDSMKLQLIQLGCSDDIMRIYETERWKIVVDSYLFYYVNRNQLSASDRGYCLDAIRQAWKGIDFPLVSSSLCHKLGYMPLRFSWTMFRFEEELYFMLKRLLHRL